MERVAVLDQPRWAVYGVVDGLVAGAVTGFALLAVPALVVAVVYGQLPTTGDIWAVAAIAAVYGGGIGLFGGLLGGLLIDAVRYVGVTDRTAVWSVMVPLFVLGALVFHIPLVMAVVAAAVVVVDLLWRLARLRRPAATG